MTNENLTLIGVLVDRSGSMASIRNDMEGGINNLLKEQKALPGQCEVTIAQFDTCYGVVTPLTGILNVRDYVLTPRGATALNDAVGKFITDIGAELRNRPEHLRPSKVVIVIVTDGYENSSKEWTTTAVKDLITTQREQWNWQFIFMGKDIDSFSVADGLGINRASTIDFRNPVYAAAATSSNLAAYRSSGDADFLEYSSSQAKAAMKEGRDSV